MRLAVVEGFFADNGSDRIAWENALAWVFLEIALALGVAIAIVWWTLPKKRRDAVPPPDDRGGPA